MQATQATQEQDRVKTTSATTPQDEEQDSISSTEPMNMSKNQMKKLARRAKWEAKKQQMKVRKKENKKARQELKRKLQEAGASLPPPPQKRQRVENQQPCSINVIVDLDFYDKMVDRELTSLRSQVTRMYSENSKYAKHPVNLICTSFSGAFADDFRDKIGSNSFEKWTGIQFTDQHWSQLDALKETPKENIIYLTADSPNVITTLDEDKTYIIGGIVDKNRHKNLCLNIAKEHGVHHAKLPIGEYIKLSSRTVLATNHVFEIMSLWLETKDWEGSFLKVIPPRKGVEPKRAESVADESTHKTDDDCDADDEPNDEHTQGEDQEVDDFEQHSDDDTNDPSIANDSE